MPQLILVELLRVWFRLLLRGPLRITAVATTRIQHQRTTQRLHTNRRRRRPAIRLRPRLRHRLPRPRLLCPRLLRPRLLRPRLLRPRLLRPRHLARLPRLHLRQAHQPVRRGRSVQASRGSLEMMDHYRQVTPALALLVAILSLVILFLVQQIQLQRALLHRAPVHQGKAHRVEVCLESPPLAPVHREKAHRVEVCPESHLLAQQVVLSPAVATDPRQVSS
ncbi:hypothetical protein F4819DRAFT_372501 [Hypoxylon fuscum]|nr:hypothetical protein F4819DRAFT_372501 [Hypoxylon fuscum]